MALTIGGLESMALLPALGAVVLLPSAAATALRIHQEDDPREGTERSVDALLLRVIDTSDLDLGAELDLDLSSITSMRNLPTELRTSGQSTDSPYDNSEGPTHTGLDTWSVVWYCGMFAAFTSLFLIMPCSQVLCRAGLLHGHSDPRLRPRAPLGAFQAAAQGYATPPPPYKQFAPPSYEDVILDLGWATPGKAVAVSPLALPPALLPPMQRLPEKEKEGMEAGLDVYVIPLRSEPSSPSTQAAA